MFNAFAFSAVLVRENAYASDEILCVMIYPYNYGALPK